MSSEVENEMGDGMDWLDTEPTLADRELDALTSVGNAAKLSVFSILKTAFAEAQAETGLSHADLAKRLRVSRPYVSRLLQEPSNVTIETAARLLFVLGHEFRLRDPLIREKRQEPTFLHWMDVADQPRSVFRATMEHGRCHIEASPAINSASVAIIDDLDGPEVLVAGCGERDGIYQQISPRTAAKVRRPHQMGGLAYVEA